LKLQQQGHKVQQVRKAQQERKAQQYQMVIKVI
jgi:hypothetical protein